MLWKLCIITEVNFSDYYEKKLQVPCNNGAHRVGLWEATVLHSGTPMLERSIEKVTEKFIS